MSHCIDLPFILNGLIVEPKADAVEIDYSGDVRVRMPRLTERDFSALAENREPLHTLTLADVSRYLANAGANWFNPDYPLRREAVDLACRITGYSEPMLERDYSLIGDYLMYPNNFYDLLSAELFDSRILDEWVTNQVARIRAFPRGRVLHVMVGNVPMAGIYSIVRSVLTRNHTVVKLPARDPVTCIYFIRSLIDSNPPGHPISRALSVGYWDRDSPLWEPAIASADLVCGWGQGPSLQSIKRKIPQGVPFLEFGPKRSFAVIHADDATTANEAALRVAHDVAVYDQEACFSPQRVFVLGDERRFLQALPKWFRQQQRFLPKGEVTPDIDTHLLRTKLEARYRGWEVIDDESGWSIIVCRDPFAAAEHPLSRTLFVHPIRRIEDIVPFIDDETQTISAYPFHDRAERLADIFCAHGSVRLCEAGTVSHFRQGFTHDGLYALQHFVRLAYIDKEMTYTFKYGPKVELASRELAFFGATSEEALRP